VNCTEYGAPTAPAVRGEAVPIVKVAFAASVKLPVVVRLCESVSVTENVVLAALGGVPLRNPPDVSMSQPGSPDAVHV
jgi:hypothetical protein